MNAMHHDDHPFIAIWETTQACDLACKHCRAEARPERDQGELSTAEGKHLLQSFAAAGVPLVVLTGGDPAKRPDLVELVAYGKSLGLGMGLTPSATPLVTPALIGELARAGLSRLAVSIDGANAAVHDSFRGLAGGFECALSILQSARQERIPTQINTSIHAQNLSHLPEIIDFVRSQACTLWSVFFVVPTGRATRRMALSAEQVEEALELLADTAERESFAIKTTAAPHYRRVLLQRGRGKTHGARGIAGLDVNEGRGFMFVSHRGDIFPSGFLPLSCGNVRDYRDPMTVYRFHDLFRALRDPKALEGKCRACQYKKVCGGSRARAYAHTGNPLAADPACAYVPPGYVEVAPRAPRRLEVVD
jgi:AdoMet-dependent heme synthase